jgi:hypothetical protein
VVQHSGRENPRVNAREGAPVLEAEALESRNKLSPGVVAMHAEQARRRAAGLPIGRPKGSPNKLTTVMREALLHAYDEIGGQEAFVAWARKHPSKFYALLFKAIAREREPKAPDPTVEVFIQTASGMVPVERRRSMFDDDQVIDVDAPERSEGEVQ